MPHQIIVHYIIWYLWYCSCVFDNIVVLFILDPSETWKKSIRKNIWKSRFPSPSWSVAPAFVMHWISTSVTPKDRKNENPTKIVIHSGRALIVILYIYNIYRVSLSNEINHFGTDSSNSIILDNVIGDPPEKSGLPVDYNWMSGWWC